MFKKWLRSGVFKKSLADDGQPFPRSSAFHIDNVRVRREEVHDRYDFAGLKVYEKLQSAEQQSWKLQKQDSHVGRDPTVEYQLPLPSDIMYSIVDTFLADDEESVNNISLACRSFAQLCISLRFRTITLSPENRSSVETFATMLSQTPHLIDFIRVLKIHNKGHLFKPWSILAPTPEEEYLCFILTRPFPNLQRLEMSLAYAWDRISPPIQHAFYTAFARPSLSGVLFHNTRISVELFSHLSQISSLDIRTEVDIPDAPPDIGQSYCMPESLSIKDVSRTFRTNTLFHEHSALKLTKLKHMRLITRGRHLEHLSTPFNMCSNTLTSLEVYNDSWGGT